MDNIALQAREARASGAVPRHADARDVVLGELCSTLFSSLSRADQRGKGVEYVRGLLGAEGRKSIRNIARLAGGRATEQNLHHFISSSTWDWAPVRATLAQYVARVAPPQAWVVQPTVIPKSGEHSVGVDRRFVPALGRVLSAQQAVGIWSASEELSMPVNWRLHLSQAWLDDMSRRSQASIPDDVRTRAPGEYVVESVTELVSEWGLPSRPVVLDSWEPGGMEAVRRLRAAGLPFVVRVDSTLSLDLAEPAPAGHAVEALPAHQILGAYWERRRPVTWTHGGPDSRPQTSLVAGVRVRTRPGGVRAPRAGGSTAGTQDLLLLGVGSYQRRGPQELWLSDSVELPPAELFRLTRLAGRVDRELSPVADGVGIRDFTGRSFGGWHRHVTLASAAHAVAALARTDDRRPSHVS